MRDDAQMMLLTAVVLVVGFVLLTGMVARVAEVSEQTDWEEEDPITTEANAIGLALIEVMGAYQNYSADQSPTWIPDNPQEYADQMGHLLVMMAQQEQSRGYAFQGDFTLECQLDLADDDTWIGDVEFQLTDGRTKVNLEVTKKMKESDVGICPGSWS